MIYAVLVAESPRGEGRVCGPDAHERAVSATPAPATYAAIPDRVLGSLDPARQDLPSLTEARTYAEAQAIRTGRPWRVYRVAPSGSWTPMGCPVLGRAA